jgi:CRP-like cAMP-binding protein
MASFDLLLHHISRHIQLSPGETDFFLSLLQARQLRRKEHLLLQGTVCKTENFITKGCLRTYTIDDNGLDHIVALGIEDWWVSDLGSFLTQTPAHYFIDALEDTEVVQISKNNLELLYHEVPRFERFFRILLQNAYVAQERRINQNLSFTAEERYKQFVQKYPGLEQRIAQKHIASYLGITPVFLSMLRRKLAGK